MWLKSLVRLSRCVHGMSDAKRREMPWEARGARRYYDAPRLPYLHNYIFRKFDSRICFPTSFKNIAQPPRFPWGVSEGIAE